METSIPSSSNVYSPLNEARREIRLLQFLPPLDEKDDEQFIRLSLHTVSMDDKPVYNALSYEWRGHVDESYALARCVVDGHEISPTRNLLLALSQIRRKNIHRKLMWVDAICINQKNVEEREKQVRMMFSIFNDAFYVVAWLGQEQDRSDLAIGILNCYENFRCILYWLGNRLMGRGLDYWVSRKLADERLADHWIAIRKLLERSYWQRNWVVQELAIAHWCRVLGLCGSQSFFLFSTGELMVRFIRLLASPNQSLRAHVRAFLAHPFSSQHRLKWLTSHRPIPDHSHRLLLGFLENTLSFRSIFSLNFFSATQQLDLL